MVVDVSLRIEPGLPVCGLERPLFLVVDQRVFSRRNAVSDALLRLHILDQPIYISLLITLFSERVLELMVSGRPLLILNQNLPVFLK